MLRMILTRIPTKSSDIIDSLPRRVGELPCLLTNLILDVPRMSIEVTTKIFSPFVTPSPRKHPELTLPLLRHFSIPQLRTAKIILECLSRVDIVSPALSASQAHDKTFVYPKERDIASNLSPSRTNVERPPMVIPPKPQTSVHRHPKSYTNEIIMTYERTTSQKAYRVFLDSIYYLCGFRTWYQREDYKQGITPLLGETLQKFNLRET
jgi:hypothetical protein